MAEIRTPPRIEKDASGNDVVSFTSDNTIADVVRWIVSEGAADEVKYLLSEVEHLQPVEG